DIDGVIIVSTPQDVAVMDARRAIRLVKKMEVPVLGIVENMSEFVCPNCGETYNIFGSGGPKQASEEYGVDVLGTLPLDPRIVELSDQGKPFVISEPESRAAKDFAKLVANVAKKTSIK
ncbi:hypothetical protein EU545_05115, partial [Candidatus Thorarchaeota archaeon]